jgi:uncharacterized protein (TIGR03086 family)
VDQLEAHERAQAAFAEVLAGVKPDQLEAATPCPDWTVWGVIDHLIAGNWRVVGEAHATPDDPDQLVEAHAVSASAAHATFSEQDGLTRTYIVRIGPIPGTLFIALRTTDALVHAWDIATATGRPTDLDPELAAAMLEMSQQRITPELRGEGGPFGPEQECSEDQPMADRLAAFLGRRPGHAITAP